MTATSPVARRLIIAPPFGRTILSRRASLAPLLELCVDLLVDVPQAGFDAVVSFYALNNLPQDELGPLLNRVAGWLRPGGWFLASLPSSDNPGWRGEWLGTEMYFAGCDPEANRRLAEEAGLEVVRDELETMVEPEGEVRWQWLLARRR
jgi:SAM-dependent methyltransferase